MQSLCSSVTHRPVSLSHHLKAHPPVNVSSHDPGDGGRCLTWSSPYSASSTLSKNLSYQLSYRSVKQDTWTTVEVRNTQVKLPRQLLLPGHRYEARVGVKVSVGHWSDWSPLVTWKNKEDPGQLPSLHCVLVTEREVICSWEVTRERATFITYQLVCRRNQTAPPKSCCTTPTVTADQSTSVKYSCSLSAHDPAQLLLELLPTHMAKTFKAHQHIRPQPPRQIKVREKRSSSWIVEWTEPSTASKVRLFYQVCYYDSLQQGCSTLVNISDGSLFLILHAESLTPSQLYKVKVRSLVVPGSGSRYEGPPSEWTDAVEWTSHAATWSPSTLISVLISVLIITAFFTLFTFPLCKRRIVLWVDSVPSPGKSKILSEIQASSSHTLQREIVALTKGHGSRNSICLPCSSSDSSLWTPTSIEKTSPEPDDGFWSHENSLTPPEKGFQSDLWMSDAPESVDIKCKEEETKPHLDHSTCPVNRAPNTGIYVFLPNPTTSRSTQDVVSTTTHTHTHHTAEREQNCPEKTDDIQPDTSQQATVSDQPLDYTSGPFTSWPHGGIIQPSGYCHLPPPT
ncbi:cytokine receptor common subunit beta isoform X2 [Cynoglossus semilaevis]|nr:uncharacterized protein LOC103393261 isoform X2 [Cynoglossus semilaevis]